MEEKKSILTEYIKVNDLAYSGIMDYIIEAVTKRQKNIICLFGSVGAGKTTFTSYMVNRLANNMKESIDKSNSKTQSKVPQSNSRSVKVSSPTFAICHDYGEIIISAEDEAKQNIIHEQSIKIWHSDLYRLKSPEELRELGIIDHIEQGGVVIIEWPDMILPLLYHQTDYRAKTLLLNINKIKSRMYPKEGVLQQKNSANIRQFNLMEW
jgi:tRNA threonylcarbamoyladenosine biosynthesis protein TsaE